MTTKRRKRLEDIRVASPCPTSWEEMLGDERVRFCNICSKHVYNLSAMSKVEAELLINRSQEGLCARIYIRKDRTVMTSDCPVGLAAIRKRIAKRMVAVAAVVAGLLTGATSVVMNHVPERRMGRISIRPDHPSPPTKEFPVVDQENAEKLVTLGYVSN